MSQAAVLPVKRRSVVRLVFWPVAVLAMTAAGCNDVRPETRLQRAMDAADKSDYQRAVDIAKAIPPEDPNWGKAQFLLGKLDAAYRGAEAGRVHYERIPRDGSPESIDACIACAAIHTQEQWLSGAAECYAYCLEHRPQDSTSRGLAADIMTKTGQRTLAEQHLFAVLKTGRIGLSKLVQLTAPDRKLPVYAVLSDCVARHPEDMLAQLGLATQEARAGQTEAALERARLVVAARPDLGAAQGLLGELLLEADPSQLAAWSAQVPAAAEDDPRVWYVRGRWARRENESRVAAKCFWEAVRRAPHSREAMFQFGQVMTPIDREAGAAITERAAQLKEYSELMERVLIEQGSDRTKFERMIALLLEMGREWEAWAWAKEAANILGPTGWPIPILQSLAHVPEEDGPRFRPDLDLSRIHDLSDWPGIETLAPGAAAPTSPAASTKAAIRFADRASDVGIDFTYFQGADRSTRGVRIFESTGGGVGVIDLDQDGMPDLYLTQGQAWPLGEDAPVPTGEHRDRLFRNAGGTFADITEAAGLAADLAYGQGCSCGDFNNDGFPDIYVANIGVNKLLLNNGDGTFTDVAPDSGLTASEWTTSCLILDLNADGIPDLYDVNYLQGESVFRVECSANRCSVSDYEGAPDRVLLSQGDGTFQSVADATPQRHAKGLGVVALHSESDSRPSLFIANDQVPNFYLRPTDIPGKYVDEALLYGLAVNMDGKPTACMGVAAGDVNHDRQTDLFVTNFEGEANNLYMQRSDGSFEDAIVGTGLLAPGVSYVGWGSQFLDADNNGELDLVVSNGHVADFGESGVEYKMPTQFFRNLGDGRFQQSSPAEVGPLFGTPVLGRTIATLDANRDGRMDFVLSSIAAPAALALNETEGGGRWLGVRLRARTTARDAIGATVEVRMGDDVRWQRLIAGDGYQATNERRLHFGLGDIERADRIVIRWPSGATSEIADLDADCLVEVVEGQPELTVWRDGSPRSGRCAVAPAG
ncbi:MAG: VCBS repeat-containing protein [Planctomyces sp.]|nr:VCBS repeat-containing protein [Planctomyces sp.]